MILIQEILFQHSLANLWVSYIQEAIGLLYLAQFQHSLANLWVSYPWRTMSISTIFTRFQHSLANLWVSYYLAACWSGPFTQRFSILWRIFG